VHLVCRNENSANETKDEIVEITKNNVRIFLDKKSYLQVRQVAS